MLGRMDEAVRGSVVDHVEFFIDGDAVNHDTCDGAITVNGWLCDGIWDDGLADHIWAITYGEWVNVIGAPNGCVAVGDKVGAGQFIIFKRFDGQGIVEYFLGDLSIDNIAPEAFFEDVQEFIRSVGEVLIDEVVLKDGHGGNISPGHNQLIGTDVMGERFDVIVFSLGQSGL